MKNKIFVEAFSRSAVVSAIVTSYVSSATAVVSTEIATPAAYVTEQTSLHQPTSNAQSSQQPGVVLQSEIGTWNKKLQREFRKLMLEEAKGSITTDQLERLDRLSAWRRRFESPRTGNEILLEIRQRRMIEKLLETLAEYVEFKKAENS
jgi:hypothetical protein